MKNIDPNTLPIQLARLPNAMTALEKIWGTEDPPFTESTFEDDETLADVLAHYDFGEPDWNGALIGVCRHVLPNPTDIEITSFDEIPIVDPDYDHRFHHGNVVVNGDFTPTDSLWITGNLTVRGVVNAGFLDSFPDFIVAGDFEAYAAEFSGQGFVLGISKVRDFVSMQESAWMMFADLQTPLFICAGSDEGPTQINAALRLNPNKQSPPFDELAKALKLAPANEAYAHDIIARALAAIQ